MRRVLVSATLVLAAVLAVSAAEQAPTPAAAPQPTTIRTYRYSFLADSDAAKLVTIVCAHSEAVCRAENPSRGVHVLRAPAAVHEQFAALLKENDVAPRTVRLQIHLLSSRLSPSQTSRPLPENAAKALADLARIMPKREWLLEDSGELLSAEGGQTNVAGYMFTLKFSRLAGEPDKLFVRDFVMLESGKGVVMQTSFQMNVGETIVVGTTQKAGPLVVLLTAAP